MGGRSVDRLQLAVQSVAVCIEEVLLPLIDNGVHRPPCDFRFIFQQRESDGTAFRVVRNIPLDRY